MLQACDGSLVDNQVGCCVPFQLSRISSAYNLYATTPVRSAVRSSLVNRNSVI